MKHNLKYVISLVFMLMLTQSTWADPTVTIIKKVNGSPAAAATTPPERWNLKLPTASVR